MARVLQKPGFVPGFFVPDPHLHQRRVRIMPGHGSLLTAIAGRAGFEPLARRCDRLKNRQRLFRLRGWTMEMLP